MLYYFIVPWGTHGLVNTPWTHHVLHLFLVEWGTLLLGVLVHFGTLCLYRFMYCMLRSSQPLIRIFYLLILATHFESGQDLVMTVVLSFLFKGESCSFVKCLWLLDLNNRKTFLWKFFWICFASGVCSNGDKLVFSFLALWKFS